MERRGGGWRSIPPELAVPLVLYAVVESTAALFGRDSGAWRLVTVTEAAHALLTLCGLRELRRRSVGTTATLVAIAAGLQVVGAMQFIVSGLIFPLLEDGWPERWFAIARALTNGSTIASAVVLTIAARAWRSVLAPLVVLTAVLSYPLWFLQRWIFELVDPPVFTALTVIFALGYAASMLGIYARLGRGVTATPDPARAVRGARRVMIALRIRVGLGLILGVMVILGVDWLLFELGPVGLYVFFFGSFAPAVGMMSGLLGLARSDVAGLSRFALCVAAFGVTWNLYGGGALSYEMTWAYRPEIALNHWSMASGALSLACIAAGVWGIRRYAVVRGDPVLRVSASRCLAGYVVCSLAATACAVAGAYLLLLVAQLAASLVLTRLYARTVVRIAVNAATDVF